MKNDVKVINTDLTIQYNINDVIVELMGTTDDTLPFEFRILDKEQNRSSGATTIEVVSFKDITNIIKHFNKQFKQFKQFKDELI